MRKQSLAVISNLRMKEYMSNFKCFYIVFLYNNCLRQARFIWKRDLKWSALLLVGMQTGAATVENSMEVPQKVKNRTTLSSNCTTRYSPKEYKNTNSKGYMHPCVYSSRIYNSQDMEAAQVSPDWWMDKEEVVCVCMCVCLCSEILLSDKKNELLPFTMTWMELQSRMLSEISQSEKDKYHMVSLICGI